MIKFFRRIRQQLVSQNKFSKYMLYAIGEIVLVVIGILIALSINNWNVNKIQEQKETKILFTLLKDLKQAERMSVTFIEDEQQSIKAFELVLSGRQGHKELINLQNKDSIFHEIIFNIKSNAPVIYAYMDLKSAGETGLISNEIIRNGFTLLENKIIDLDRQLEDRLSVQQLRFDDFAIEGLNFVQTLKTLPNTYNIDYGANNDYMLLLQNQKFINAIAIKLVMTDDAITNRINLLKEIKDLIKLIENELEI